MTHFYLGLFGIALSFTALVVWLLHRSNVQLKAVLLLMSGAVVSSFAALSLTLALTLAQKSEGITLALSENQFGAGVILWDSYAAVMLFVVTLIGACVLRFSDRYTDGNPKRRSFIRNLLLVCISVQLFVISGDLFLALCSLISVSVALHLLLTFYPDRHAAVACARRKFIISRIGDLFIVAAIVVALRSYGSVAFHELEVLSGGVATQEWGAKHLIALLIVGAAMAKSAQFPFHTWLPDSLEVPTPVSAMMHAGIINAGGYLVIRSQFLFEGVPVVASAMALIGGVTAALGVLVMVTQTSVKKSLAYSTVGQMGFMIMQCGLGFFNLAFIHMVGHAFYKAYAFLSSGEIPLTDDNKQRAASLSRVALVVGGALSLMWILMLSHIHDSSIAIRYLPLISAASCAAIIASASIFGGREGSVKEFLVGSAAVSLMIGLHLAISLLDETYASRSTGEFAVSSVACVLLANLFLVVLVMQLLLPNLSESPGGRKLIIHLHNGLYLDRLLSISGVLSLFRIPISLPERPTVSNVRMVGF